MNKYLLLLAAPLTLPLITLAGVKEDLQADLQKLRDASNYTWVTKTEMEGSPFNANQGAITGKAEKGGFAVISQAAEPDPVLVVQKGDKAVLKTAEGWKAAADLPEIARGGGGGAPDPNRRAQMMGRRLLTSKQPAQEAGGYLDKVTDLKFSDGAFTGQLTEEGAKELMSFGRGRGGGAGGNAPSAKDAKGNVTWWVKDGNVTKMQIKVSGKMSGRDGNEIEMKRVTTVEIKDVGTTKVEVPDDAKKKLAA